MSKTMKWLLWSLYGIALTGIFLYYLFPSDALREYAAAKVKDINPDLVLISRGMTPAFPIGVTIQGADLLNKDQPWIETDTVRIAPEIMSLFRKDKEIAFKGSAWKGNFTGTAIFSKPENDTEDTLKTETSLSGVRMEQISYIQNMTGKKVSSGILSGNIEYRQKKNSGSMDSKLAISGLGIEISTPVMKLPALTFKTVDMEIISADMKIIEIKQCAAKGDQASVTVSGTIKVNTPFEKSFLNLKTEITPDPALLASLGKGFPAALLMGGKKGPITFMIGGTVEQPALSLR